MDLYQYIYRQKAEEGTILSGSKENFLFKGKFFLDLNPGKEHRRRKGRETKEGK